MVTCVDIFLNYRVRPRSVAAGTGVAAGPGVAAGAGVAPAHVPAPVAVPAAPFLRSRNNGSEGGSGAFLEFRLVETLFHFRLSGKEA